MKKLLTYLFLSLIFTVVGFNVQASESETIQDAPVISLEISFDWLDISQAQRDDIIEKYKNKLFSEDNNTYFTKNKFSEKFKNFKKDKDYKHHYLLVNNGVTKDNEAEYCAFYYRKNTLVMYAIQYDDNPKNVYYYSAFGKLYYVDVRSDEYPNYPYSSMQYDNRGNLKSSIYFISQDLQYMYDKNKNFQGVWYKDKMFDKNGKQILTRTNW